MCALSSNALERLRHAADARALREINAAALDT
jgi:hypothetical protein